MNEWTPLGVVGLVPRGQYKSTELYLMNEYVAYSGISWICRKPCKGITPCIGEHWQPMGTVAEGGMIVDDEVTADSDNAVTSRGIFKAIDIVKKLIPTKIATITENGLLSKEDKVKIDTIDDKAESFSYENNIFKLLRKDGSVLHSATIESGNSGGTSYDYPTIYYVDTKNGSDDNDGITEQTPFLTVDKVFDSIPVEDMEYKRIDINLIPDENKEIIFSNGISLSYGFLHKYFRFRTTVSDAKIVIQSSGIYISNFEYCKFLFMPSIESTNGGISNYCSNCNIMFYDYVTVSNSYNGVSNYGEQSILLTNRTVIVDNCTFALTSEGNASISRHNNVNIKNCYYGFRVNNVSIMGYSYIEKIDVKTAKYQISSGGIMANLIKMEEM